MVNVNELKACMTRHGITQEKLAKMCGISAKTMYLRMNSGIFKSDEIEKIIDILKIENPMDIFFAHKVP